MSRRLQRTDIKVGKTVSLYQRELLKKRPSLVCFLYPLSNSKLNLSCVQMFSPYRAVNTLLLGYKNQSVSAVQGNNGCLFWDPHKTSKYSLWAGREMFQC